MGPVGGAGKTSESSQKLKAVAFDLDGTLYPNYRLYLRLLPQLLRHPVFYNAFSRARDLLHQDKSETPEQFTSFYDRQAALVAGFLKKDPQKTKQRLEILVYECWEGYFSGIELFPGLKETLLALKEAGLRLAVLSDFPPAKKLTILGLDGVFDVALSSEETGALKPSKVPFNALAAALGVTNGEILYVGNSLQFDIEGAKSAGMKAALIRQNVFRTGLIPKNSAVKADFVFQDYRQLQEYILQ